MTEMVRKADVQRMLREAFEGGHADDPQLIPNLMGSLRMFTPTFEIELTEEQVQLAETDARRNIHATIDRIYG